MLRSPKRNSRTHRVGINTQIEYLSISFNRLKFSIDHNSSNSRKRESPDSVGFSHICTEPRIFDFQAFSEVYIGRKGAHEYASGEYQSNRLTLQTVRAFNRQYCESQDGVGVDGCGCERLFSENRKTAPGSFGPIHATQHRESQYGVGIPPPECVRVR